MLSLLRTPRFAPLFWTQFLGALNDNLLKSVLVAGLTFGALSRGDTSIDSLANLATALLVLPFFLFSPIAGQLADAMDKARLAVLLKRFELLIMVIAFVGFALGSSAILLVSLFLMGTQSAFFGPVKYAILPQHLRDEELVGGNALIEAATFIAIVVGSLVGTLATALPMGLTLAGGGMIALAALGMRLSRRIPTAPSAHPVSLGQALRPLRAISSTFRSLRTRALWATVLGISAFWLIGAIVLGQLPGLVTAFGGGEWGLSLLLISFSVGIGAGSFMAERLAARLGRLSFGTIGYAAFLMSAFLFAASASQTLWMIGGSLLLVGASGGILVVPLYAQMQRLARESERSRVIAANNLLNALFMVAGAGFAAWRATSSEPTTPVGPIWFDLGLFGLLFASVATALTFRDFLHLAIRGFMCTIYRVRTSGMDVVPTEGPALIVANHQSFVDAFLIGALVNRPTRFVMDHRMANLPVLRHFFRYAGAIPIASRREDPEILAAAMATIEGALADGELVVLFPEGRCTRDGELGQFRAGVERILAAQPVAVFPVALDGLFGSFFSYAHGNPMQNLPRRCWSQVTLRAGERVEKTHAPSAEYLERRVRLLIASA